MPNGLQSFQIAADTDVRTKGIDDSMLSYSPNTLSDIPRNPVRPTKPTTGNPFQFSCWFISKKLSNKTHVVISRCFMSPKA